MAQSEAHYRAAAQGLEQGFLGSQFGRSSLPDSAVSNIHRLAAFREEAELMGLKSGAIAGIQLRDAALARSVQEARKEASEKSKRTTDTILFLNLLDQRIADLDFRMAELEGQLVEQFGEQWAEQVALEVLDPDEMPQRRDGESMADYQARVYDALEAEFLDEGGNIKPEYKDHPRYGDAAKYMQYRFDKDAAVELRSRLSDPDLSPEEAREIIESAEGTPTLDRLYKAQDGLTNEVGDQAVTAAADELFDERVDSRPVASEDMAFLKGL